MSERPRPKAVLFDIGNVVVRWDPRTLYSKIFPDPAERERFLAEVCTMTWHVQHDWGVSWDETIPALVAEHPEHAGAIRAWKDRWWEMFSGPIPETVSVIEDLHASGVPLYGLTNMAAEVAEGAFALSPAFGCFEDIVVSGVERVIKPDPRIFQIACARSGFAPHELLFIDDSARNVEAAARLGFDIHHFEDPAALRPALQARGLL